MNSNNAKLVVGLMISVAGLLGAGALLTAVVDLDSPSAVAATTSAVADVQSDAEYFVDLDLSDVEAATMVATVCRADTYEIKALAVTAGGTRGYTPDQVAVLVNSVMLNTNQCTEGVS